MVHGGTSQTVDASDFVNGIAPGTKLWFTTATKPEIPDNLVKYTFASRARYPKDLSGVPLKLVGPFFSGDYIAPNKILIALATKQ